MVYKLIDDISTLTTYPVSSIKTLFDDMSVCIGHDVYESSRSADDNGDSIADINIGIGTLSIKCNGDNIKYRFSPNAYLNKCVLRACVDNEDVLTSELEEKFKSRILSAYKELF